MSDDHLSEEERAAQEQLRAEAAGLRERVGHLERSLAEAKEAAAWAAGQDAARREAVEAYMARLDEERFERKRLQEQLNASSEEVKPAASRPHPGPPTDFSSSCSPFPPLACLAAPAFSPVSPKRLVPAIHSSSRCSGTSTWHR